MALYDVSLPQFGSMQTDARPRRATAAAPRMSEEDQVAAGPVKDVKTVDSRGRCVTPRARRTRGRQRRGKVKGMLTGNVTRH